MYSSATASYSPSSASAAKLRMRSGKEPSATRKRMNAKALRLRTGFIGGAKLRQQSALGVAKNFQRAMVSLCFKLGSKYEALHDLAIGGLSLARRFFCLRTGGGGGKEWRG